jgi:hypothetical protein
LLDPLFDDPVPAAHVGGGERPMRAGISGHDVGKRVAHRLEERPRQSRWRRHAEGVAQPAGVLGGRQPLLPRQVHKHGPTLGQKHRRPRAGQRARARLFPPPRRDARGQLVAREVADADEKVVQPVGAVGAPPLVQALPFLLHFGEDGGIEQLA